MSHINGTAANPTNPAWEQADSCVCSWIFKSVVDVVLDRHGADPERLRTLAQDCGPVSSKLGAAGDFLESQVSLYDTRRSEHH